MSEPLEKDEKILKLEEWAKEASSHEAAEWDRMPEIYLYMDQVLTYMNKQLSFYERSGGDTPLTSSMINNYVKDGILDRPEQKKYGRDHLAMLMVICLLKPVLSIQDISVLLKSMLEHGTKTELYQNFCEAQTAAFQDICGRLTEASSKGKEELYRLAVEFSVEARARRSAAERILSELEETPIKPEKGSKNKKKADSDL